ncbi:porin [Acidithiobacillus sp.]
MKKNLIALAVAAAIIAPVSAIAADPNTDNAKTGPVVFGYAQITGSQQFGTGGPEGLVFGAHRIRLGFKGEAVPGVNYYFQYKWDGDWQSTPLNTTFRNQYGQPIVNAIPGSASGVQDAYINFAFVPEVQLQVGKFRVPVGLERQESGNELMFIQRSMNQSLGANRSAGAMFHSPNVMGSGLYYSLGIFDNHSLDGNDAFNSGNVALPLGAGQNPVGGILTNGTGQYLLGGMVGYKVGPLLDVELSGARASAAQYTGVPASKAIDAWNVGAKGALMGLKYMAEYSHVSSYQGYEGVGAQDWYAALAVNLHQMTLTPDWLDIEPAFRFERFQWTGNNNLGGGLNNYTFGVNYYVNPNNPYAARVQLNYVVPSGGAQYRANYVAGNYATTPANAYLYNTLALQFQAGF